MWLLFQKEPIIGYMGGENFLLDKKKSFSRRKNLNKYVRKEKRRRKRKEIYIERIGIFSERKRIFLKIKIILFPPRCNVGDFFEKFFKNLTFIFP